MKPQHSHHCAPCSHTFTTLGCPVTCGIKPEGMTGLKHIHYTSLRSLLYNIQSKIKLGAEWTQAFSRRLQQLKFPTVNYTELVIQNTYAVEVVLEYSMVQVQHILVMHKIASVEQ